MRRSALVALTLSVALVSMSCSSSGGVGSEKASNQRPSSTTGAASGSPSGTGSLDWGRCTGKTTEMAGLECARLKVPVDPAKPEGPTVELALARKPSTGSPQERIGSLVMNPGGPGGSGLEFLAGASSAFPSSLTDRFDLVSWDPRGVGESDPVRCLNDEQKDAQLEGDLSPDTDAERARLEKDAAQLQAACEKNNPQLINHMSTADVAADLDRIRAAVGDEQLTYMGFSYGTAIGATYATLFPTRSRALVLDGSVAPDSSAEQEALVQATGFERVLGKFVDACNASTTCALAPDARGAIDAARASLESDPITVDGPGGSRTLGPDLFDFGLGTALYESSTWSATADAIKNLRDGGADTLLSLVDRQTGRQPDGTYDNSSDAQVMVNCADQRDRPTAAQAREAEARIIAAAPRYGPLLGTGLDTCSAWPTAANPTPVPTGAGAPPVLVVGTVGDPATPYEWAQQMAAALAGGRLLTYEGDGHTAFLSGGPCIQDAVVNYLVNLTLPADGTRCPTTETPGDQFGGVRQTVVDELTKGGVPEKVANCIVDGMIAQVGEARFNELILRSDQEEITKLAAAQTLKCATAGG
ncbi:MAG: alpha/beta hydrolase [Microthrixaceae bacterium]